MNVVVLGRGRVGRGLHSALKGGDHAVALRSSRGRLARELADADVVVLAVPDGSIPVIAARIAPHTPRRCVILHCAGALGPDAIGDVARTAGAMHPLVSFADPKRPPSMEGASFGIAGPPKARRVARRIAKACGARALETDAVVQGSAYHAAAALVANGAAALVTVSVTVLEGIGVDRQDAQQALGALLGTVAENVQNVGVPEALSGPVMRGDADTVERHRRALQGDSLRAYDAIAPTIIAVARSLGSTSPATLRRLSRLFQRNPK